MSLNGRSLNQAIQELLVKKLTVKNTGAGIDPYLNANSASQILSLVGELRASLALSSKGGTAFYHKFVGTPTVNRDITIPDKAFTIADNADITTLFAQTLIGDANKKYIEMTYLGSPDGDSILEASALDGSMLSNAVVGTKICLFLLKLPTTLGSLKLYLDSIRIAVGDADVDNYIGGANVYGITVSTEQIIEGYATPLNTVQDHYYDFDTEDCSGDSHVMMKMVLNTDEVNALDFGIPRLRVWYDT